MKDFKNYCYLKSYYPRMIDNYLTDSNFKEMKEKYYLFQCISFPIMNDDKFKDIDSILDKWLPKYGLTVMKGYQDYFVRLINVIDDSGLSYKIWIEKNDEDDSYIVKAHWDLGKKINRKRVTKSWEKASKFKQLIATLDNAYEEVNEWITSNGNTRRWTK